MSRRLETPGHPQFEPEFLEENGFRHRFDFFSHDTELNAVELDGAWCCESESAWTMDRHDLAVRATVETPALLEVLFGSEGFAPKSSVLGLVLDWWSKTSSVRGSSHAYLFTINDLQNNEKLIREYTFAPGYLRGELFVSLAIYLMDPGQPSASERHFARYGGARIGYLADDVSFRIDGGGSEFPVIEIDESAGPLWRYHGPDWNDVDAFFDTFSSENIALVLNRTHSDFSALEGTKRGRFNTPVARQVLAIWIATFLQDFKNHGDREDEVLPGSIAEAAFKLRDAIGSPLEFKDLLESCQEFVDRRLS